MQAWVPALSEAIQTAAPWASFSYRYFAKGGETLGQGVARVTAALPTMPDLPRPQYVFLNWGANEMVWAGMPAEATWRGYYTTILDAINAKWPGVPCYLTRPWAQGQDADADTLAGWIATVVTDRSTFAHLGDDERVWLKGADDGATNTTDGIHYSTAGQAAAVAAKLAVLGY